MDIKRAHKRSFLFLKNLISLNPFFSKEGLSSYFIKGERLLQNHCNRLFYLLPLPSLLLKGEETPFPSGMKVT